MLGSSLRMLQFRLGMDGVAVARNKQACPSHPHVLESDRTPAFLLLLLLLLLLVASAAGASAAAAAAAAAAATALRTAGWSCFIFYSNSFAKAIWWWMLYRTLRKVTYEYEKKHAPSVGVYSGIVYGCVRYVLRAARVDSGWGVGFWIARLRNTRNATEPPPDANFET